MVRCPLCQQRFPQGEPCTCGRRTARGGTSHALKDLQDLLSDVAEDLDVSRPERANSEPHDDLDALLLRTLEASQDVLSDVAESLAGTWVAIADPASFDPDGDVDVLRAKVPALERLQRALDQHRRTLLDIEALAGDPDVLVNLDTTLVLERIADLRGVLDTLQGLVEFKRRVTKRWA